jgi:alpha-L-arabinofuranosidase
MQSRAIRSWISRKESSFPIAYVQEGLEEIEYVTGGTDTKWGAVRARDGHPAPFTLR